MKRLILTVAVVMSLAGCARESAGTKDSPIVHPTDNHPAHVINFPNGFANVAWKCDGEGHRIYTTTRDAAPVVVDDSSCGGSSH